MLLLLRVFMAQAGHGIHRYPFSDEDAQHFKTSDLVSSPSLRYRPGIAQPPRVTDAVGGAILLRALQLEGFNNPRFEGIT